MTHSSHMTEKQLKIWDAKAKEVKTLYAVGDSFQGNLNDLSVVCDQYGNLYVWRTPKPYPEILPKIAQDLRGTGFLTSGGSYRFRTVREQVNFMEKASRLNLPSIVATYADGSGMLLTFVQGIPYNSYLHLGGISATKDVLDGLIMAHTQNVVYGDRWAKNTMIKPNGNIVEIDFDIELTGKNAREFELAQMLYHILLFSSRRSEILEFLADYLKNKLFLSEYNLSTVVKFLSNYTNYFQDQPNEGGIKQEVAELIHILQSVSGERINNVLCLN